MEPRPHIAEAEPVFPAVPRAWFHLCASHELTRVPRSVELAGESWAAYRTAAGTPVVLAGRCPHLGANLARGYVIADRLVCPLHGWEFGQDGRCAHAPALSRIPDWACLPSFPVEEQGGQVFFHTHSESRFPLPFFDGRQPEELRPARPFELDVETPWHLLAANGFDVQHFRMTHDRELVGEPVIDCPTPFSRRLSAVFKVCGRSWSDRITRKVAGNEVALTVTDWCGGLVLVRAAFRRTTTYGMVSLYPLPNGGTRARIIVWVPRRSFAPARWVVDPLNAAVRRIFIRAFLRRDLPCLGGLRYQPSRMTSADRKLAAHLHWLSRTAAPTDTP
jgi:nitrite reductase/ring-hydroxylating ferredoxin subunit